MFFLGFLFVTAKVASITAMIFFPIKFDCVAKLPCLTFILKLSLTEVRYEKDFCQISWKCNESILRYRRLFTLPMPALLHYSLSTHTQNSNERWDHAIWKRNFYWHFYYGNFSQLVVLTFFLLKSLRCMHIKLCSATLEIPENIHS